MLSEDIIINGKKLWFALLLFEADFFKRYPDGADLKVVPDL